MLKHISIALFCAALALLHSEHPQRFTYLINALGAFTIFSKAWTLLIYNPPAKWKWENICFPLRLDITFWSTMLKGLQFIINAHNINSLDLINISFMVEKKIWVTATVLEKW